MKRLFPLLNERKQLLVLLVIAAWCSVCAMIQFTDSSTIDHPIGSLVMAVLMSAPALLFGGVLFWWFSPWRTRPRPGKINTMW
jgi:hypothetical protein